MSVKPVDDIAKAASGYWNSNPVSVSNPGGLDESDDGLIAGHVDNFPAAVGAVGRMTQWVGERSDQIDAKAFAVGGAVVMTWDAGTSDANPGAGRLRGNGAAGAITQLFVSNTDADGIDISALLLSWDDSSSTDIKGDLTISGVGTPTTRLTVKISGAITAATGYVKIPVTVVSVSSAPTDGLAVVASFVRAGQKGDPGSVSSVNGKVGGSVTLVPADIGAVGQGWHTIGIPAGACRTRNTGGAAAGVVETSTYKVMRASFDFDPATAQYIQCAIPMPKSANLAAGVKVQWVWTAASGSGSVVWAAQAQWQRDDDPTDGAWGAAQSVTDTLLAAGDRHVSAISATITPAGTSGAGCDLLIQVYRDAPNGSDTLAVIASLLGLRVIYSVNAADDS